MQGRVGVDSGPLHLACGVLLGYQGYAGQFHRNNPDLDAKLVSHLSVCNGAPAEVPHNET